MLCLQSINYIMLPLFYSVFGKKHFFATLSQPGQLIARMNIHVFRRLMSTASTKTFPVTSSKKSDSTAVFPSFSDL